MFKPNSFIKYLKHQDKPIDGEFTLLCWNVAKLTLDRSYKKFIDSLIEKFNLDILLLQEVKKNLSCELELHDYSYILSPNIETKKHIFGVLSAFRSVCKNEFFLLTKKRELKYATHKISLITHHDLSNGKTLLIVNIHAINFVRNSDFKHELDYIYSAIKSHSGSMIVAGDFNTWNRKRVSCLQEFAKSLSLKRVEFYDESKIKKVFANSLDHIFYRDLELLYSQAIESREISDHNPIIARFKP